jgi:serine/threonine protein kinase
MRRINGINMSAEFEKIRDSLNRQLASFDGRLQAKADDVQMLAEIQDGISRLLSESGGSEADIRRVLQERYEAGELRKETFQLVKSMLDRFVTEQVPTGPPPAAGDNVTLTGTQILDEPADIIEPEQFNRPEEPQEPQEPEAPPHDDRHSSTTIIEEGLVSGIRAEDRVQVGSLLRDRFLLQQKVAGGSMGVVYKALDRRLAEAGSESASVAIKVLSPQLAQNGKALRALQQEAAKGRCLIHPNIVRFMDLDRDDDLFFIVMEWLEGRNLAEILDDPTTKKFEVQRAFQIVRQIGEALVYAHSCGIVHADIKPGNVMIMPNGDAKLFDFGVARVKQSQMASTASLDATDLGAMTPAYSSMQVLTGDEPVASDDVFSLACLLYRLLAGYRVFGPRNAAEAAEEGMKPQRLPALSDGQWRAMKKALSYSRVTRYDNMQEFIDALESEVKDDTISLEVERSYEVEESGGFGKWLIAIVMILGAAAVVANKLGYLDEFKAQLDQGQPPAIEQQAPPIIDKIVTDPEPIVEAPAIEEPAVIEEPAPEPVAEAVVEEPEPVAEAVVAEPEPEPVAAEPQPDVSGLFDFTQLPPATLQVPFRVTGTSEEAHTVTLLEDGNAATIEFVRDAAGRPMTLRLEEVGFSGNRSPLASGQYAFSDDGFVDFPAGQRYGRIKLTMQSDQRREADQQSTIRVMDAENPGLELAAITVFLRDDDQRAFEAQIPTNTIAFAVSQVTVDESDPAVTLDVIRFNPDSSSIVLSYQIEGVTATQNEDYFVPAVQEINFGPDQRSARVLIPLVQDSVPEGNEAFAIQLLTTNPVQGIDIYQRIIVMIRDDE